jgi:3'(2'), 5'-bisphosphate nucleotidase
MPLDPFSDPHLLDALTAIVSRAGAAILAAGAAPALRLKADQSPVTAADEAAEAAILQDLAHVLPGVPVISEEAVARGEIPALGATFILVDPLDGTREFIAGRPEYTVNIGIIVDATPVLGVIMAPPLGLIWRGVKGKGAERLRLPAGAEPGAGMERVAIRTRRAPSGGLVATLSRSYRDPDTNAFVDRLPASKRLTCGSSVKFCWLAEGTADVYPRLKPPMQWDIAAGHAILAAAGGTMIQPNGTPLRYGEMDGGFRACPFIAWGDPDAARRYRVQPAE